MKTNTDFASLLENFFTDRLMRQRNASPNTIAGYRDTFCLLFKYMENCLGKAPSQLGMEDLDATVIVGFLCWLEKQRGNSARTRNARLAAIHSFFRFAALYDPAHSALIQRVLAIPGKQYERASIEYLTPLETEALLAAPNQESRGGRRDRLLLMLMIQTGLRVSELTDLNSEDVILDCGAHVKCNGKGRKDRCTPLHKESVTALRAWLSEKNGAPTDPLFPNARGTRLSRDGVEYIVRKYVRVAIQQCPSLKIKRISPHVLRHTTAMNLLQHGVDRTVIALWLGHENLETVSMYLHADLKMKQWALEKTAPLGVSANQYKPEGGILAFLRNL
jgi:site-specific recombinase XerD